MDIREINDKRFILDKLIHYALIDSVKWTAKSCPRSPQEPDYVAVLSTRFTRRLFYIIQSVFPSKELAVTGVFCHQKPIVSISTSVSMELGDLLFVYIDSDYDNRKAINSLLLQAKMSEFSEKKLTANEYPQLTLYTEWPEFTYRRAGKLNGQKRNILPKARNGGAQYLLIDPNPFNNGIIDGLFPIGCAISDQVLQLNDSFSTELVNFLRFKTGRIIESDPYNTNDDWTKMIWDMLYIDYNIYSRRKNAKLPKIPRENSFIHITSEKMTDCSIFDRPVFEYPASNSNFFSDDVDEQGGLSLILIESDSRHDE